MTINISKQDYNDLCKIWHITPQKIPQNIKGNSVNIDKGYFKLTSEMQNPNVKYVEVPCNDYRSYVVSSLFYISKGLLILSKKPDNIINLINPQAFLRDNATQDIQSYINQCNPYRKPKTVEEKIQTLKKNVSYYSQKYLFDSENRTGRELRENTKNLEEAQNKYTEATSDSGMQKLNAQYEQEIALFNSREGAKPNWLAYDPENGNMYKAVAK